MFRRIVFGILCYLFSSRIFSQTVLHDSSAVFLLKDSTSYADANYDPVQLIHNYHNTFFYHNIRQYGNLGAVNETHLLRSDLFNSGCDLYEDYNLKSNEFSSPLKSTYFSKLKYLTGTRKEQIISIA